MLFRDQLFAYISGIVFVLAFGLKMLMDHADPGSGWFGFTVVIVGCGYAGRRELRRVTSHWFGRPGTPFVWPWPLADRNVRVLIGLFICLAACLAFGLWVDEYHKGYGVPSALGLAAFLAWCRWDTISWIYGTARIRDDRF